RPRATRKYCLCCQLIQDERLPSLCFNNIGIRDIGRPQIPGPMGWRGLLMPALPIGPSRPWRFLGGVLGSSRAWSAAEVRPAEDTPRIGYRRGSPCSLRVSMAPVPIPGAKLFGSREVESAHRLADPADLGSSGRGLLNRPASATTGVVARTALKVYFFLPRARSVPLKSWFVQAGSGSGLLNREKGPPFAQRPR